MYSQSISAACQLDWPKDRILIQVLDDSDDGSLQLLIQEEVSAWRQKGVNIIYRHRLIRTGYKAGNLKSAMSCDYVKDYEYVAIFDADFQPNSDFLKQTIPHFKVSYIDTRVCLRFPRECSVHNHLNDLVISGREILSLVLFRLAGLL